jgi:fatty acid desaturase
MQDPTPNLRQSAALRSLKSNCPLLAHSCWDTIPVALGLAHCAAVVALVFAFHVLNWPAFLAFACLYAISISWSINSIAHNFIHNPYFVSHALNRAYRAIAVEQKAAGVRVINRAHALGFLDRSLPAP